MTGFLDEFWGDGGTVGALAMAVRALAMFFLLLVMIRVAGPRSFGRKSSFDNVVAIMLGAIAARGVVGASPFGATIAACTVVVVLHRLIGRLCVTQRWLAKLVEGELVPLYIDGKLLFDNLKRTNISEADLLESHRLERQHAELSSAVNACMERNGRISFVER
jgi:uncharacterized membrane protein YcaP (DUF421 family)